MRRLILLALLATSVLPAAAKRVTVAQLEEALAADSAAHRPDAESARRIGDLELSEQLTGTALDRIASRLSLGPRTALALQLLADQSAFVDPPATELPATAFPDPATQQQMMDRARGWVIEVLPRLPNFFATRTTHRFDDTPQVLAEGGWPVRAGLHLVGTFSRQITFRDGKEVQDTVQNAGAAAPSAQEELGLHTWGEFGPELAKIMTDTAKGTVTFSHWEQTPGGLAAIYRYTVPKAFSHYSVHYCCTSRQEIAGDVPLGASTRGGRGSAGQAVNVPTSVTLQPYSETPGYHGTLAIDPGTGAVLRITLEAELKDGGPLRRAATVVQYGSITIGDRSYVCPVRSLAFSTEQTPFNGHAGSNSTLLVNETTFTNYRRLGASMRILADAPQGDAPAEAATASGAAAAPTAEAAPAGGQPVAVQAANDVSAGSPPTPPTPPPAAPEAAPAAAPAQPFVPEVSLTAASGVPDEPANQGQPEAGEFQLKLTSRLVDLGVVVTDKKGHPVGDLQGSDFEIYDNGQKQNVRFFSRFADAPVAAQSPAAAAPQRTFSNRALEAPGGAAAPSETGATILLIDESHIAWADMSHARQEILRFLGTVAPGERVGLYSMTAVGFRVLMEITADHGALTARLNKWMPTAQSVALAQEEETRNRQSFNEVRSVTDLNSVNGNQVDVPDAETTVDPMLRTMGSNPARASLIILGMVARHLSAIPGHKNLVWVSSDNVFADWQSNQVAIDKSGKQVDSFAMHAQEAMNDAHVAVYPMDVSQLEAGAIGADIRTRNVELTQAAADTASLNGGTVANDLTPGRIKAQMQQDMHPIQGPIRMVAEDTGGRVIRRAGDLAAELKSVVEEGHATYLLSFAPQSPADDQYHTLAVKLTGRHPGVSLRYRTGYLYTKEAATLHDRFQQAIWRGADANEIAVTSSVSQGPSGASLKLGIAAGDLGFAQQAGRWFDKLDIFFIQRDDAGIKAQVEGQTLGLRLKNSTYQSLLAGGVPFEHAVQLHPGMASLRVLVVDENSGRMGSVTIPAPALKAGR